MNYQIVDLISKNNPVVSLFFDEARNDFQPKKEGGCLWHQGEVNPHLFINLGKKDAFTPSKLDSIAKTIVSQVDNFDFTHISLDLPPLALRHPLRQLVIAFEKALYCFDELKSEKQSRQLETIELCGSFDQADLAQALAISRGINLCQTLANRPPNLCRPRDLADTAQQLAKRYDKLTVTVLDEAQMAEQNMNAILAVSQGSDEPARFIEMHYHNGGDSQPLVFVGKGITFDAGGLSLKPPPSMVEMKYDMCGAATVIGLIQAICEMQLPVNVVGLIASSENLPGPKALKPGDVIRARSGKTIEVLNTDAEGRLVLCDALSYAEQFNPKHVVDIATLTGAAIIALGYITNAVMGNDDALCKALIDAGQRSGDEAWQLPLNDNYQKLLDSSIADMHNISSDKSAGTITAGCFLARFAENYSWAHIDCAGTAWVSGNKRQASGRPLPLLCQFVLDNLS